MVLLLISCLQPNRQLDEEYTDITNLEDRVAELESQMSTFEALESTKLLEARVSVLEDEIATLHDTRDAIAELEQAVTECQSGLKSLQKTASDNETRLGELESRTLIWEFYSHTCTENINEVLPANPDPDFVASHTFYSEPPYTYSQPYENMLYVVDGDVTVWCTTGRILNISLGYTP